MNSIEVIQVENQHAWDEYVANSLAANPYHCYDWQQAIKDTYGHQTYAMAAIGEQHPSSPQSLSQSTRDIAGILPLVHINSYIFGNQLVSMPFFDHGGVLSDNQAVEKKLIDSAIEMGRKLKVRSIELRHLVKLTCLPHHEGPSEIQSKDQATPTTFEYSQPPYLEGISAKWSMQSHKVRLLMNLPSSSELLMKGFKSKLRSQINRPIKEGLIAIIGGIELIDDFYQVFCANMRDLGSPVHAKAFPRSVVQHFSEKAKIVVVYYGQKPIAASIMVGFKELMINPWASSLRQFSRFSANMLLYWTMLSYACDHGFKSFDFGRSTPDEGTYRFKTQWGAEPQNMYWYSIWLGNSLPPITINTEGTMRKNRAIAELAWQRLPLSVTKWIGPLIRKYISL